jgi:hypothetical protein
MRIAATQVRPQNQNQAPQQPPQETKPEPPKSDTMVEKIVDNTYLSANYAASGLSGAASGVGAWGTTGVPQTLKSTASIIKNVYKTEKIGPTLKTLALVSAVPVMAVGGAIALPVSLLAGVWQGAGEVDSSVPRQFTVGQAAGEAYKEVKEGLNSVGNGIQEEMKELGEYKLKPGEKVIDIPLIKAGKTLIMGAIGAAVGGIAGAVSAIAATATEGAKGIAGAFTDSNLNIGEKVLAAGASVISAPLHGAMYGLRTGLATVGNTIGKTWDKDSVVEGAKSIIADAKTGVAASIAPRTVLTQVKADKQ